MSRRVDGLVASVVALIAGTITLSSSADEARSFAPTGTVRLASGLRVRYECHGDQSTLGSLVRAGDALIAANDSGHLLRFDRATLAWTRERIGPVPATCLVRGEDGDVLAGFADGRIGRVDPTTLAVTEIARVSSTVQWAGIVPGAAGAARPAKPRLIAVVEARRWGEDDEGNRAMVPYSIVEDPALGKTYDPDGESQIPEGFPENLSASTFLLDRKHRLWIASDNDEWGSWCSCVDLDAGTVRPVAGRDDFRRDWGGTPWFGVEGFIERPDGQVWAYGGVTHMDYAEAIIWRVDTGRAEELYQRSNRQEPKLADRPFDPITQISDDSRPGALLVFSFGDIFRTDARLARWEKVHTMSTDYTWEEPRQSDTFPGIRSVVPVEDPGRPMNLFFATRPNGLVRLVDQRETGTRPLGAGSVGRIAASSEGLLVFEGSQDGDIWRYHEGGWSTVAPGPPYEPPPDAPETKVRSRFDQWDSTCVLVGRDGSIITVSAASADGKGTRTTARWRGGKAEILGREVASLVPSRSFLTPDGQLWNADRQVLRRFVDGRWIEVGTVTHPRMGRRVTPSGGAMPRVPINASGPPWVLLDPRYEMLLRLSHGPGFENPSLAFVRLRGAGKEGNPDVRDAIPWAEGELLLATSLGLRTVRIDGDEFITPRLEAGGRTITRLARDGRGRTWLGGEGLAVLDVDGQTLHPLDELPMIGRAKIEALAADPAHPDGAIAAVEGHGVVFVRVEGR